MKTFTPITAAVLAMLAFVGSTWRAGAQQAPAQPAAAADSFYVLTNKIEWLCSPAILGPLATNDVAYTVKNIQSNVCGVFVISYPTKLPAKTPIIVERLDDLRSFSFYLKVVKEASIQGGPPSEYVDGAIVVLEPSKPEEGKNIAYVKVGKIFYTGPTGIQFGRISSETFHLRRYGTKP